MGKAKVTSSDLGPLEQAIVDSLVLKVSHALSEKLAPHVVDVAKARCPVSSDQHAPRLTKSKSFQSVSLIRKLPAGSSADTQRRFQKLRAGEAEPSPGDAQFYRIRAKDGQGNPNKNAGQTPDVIAFRNRAVVGAVTHKPGTLRDSIRFDGITREGNTLTAKITAHADYAAAVNDGYTHRGGPNHQGNATQITGVHFMESGLDNVRSRLTDKSTYEG